LIYVRFYTDPEDLVIFKNNIQIFLDDIEANQLYLNTGSVLINEINPTDKIWELVIFTNFEKINIKYDGGNLDETFMNGDLIGNYNNPIILEIIDNN